MTTLNLNGRWTGVIVYGYRYRRLQGKNLYFDLEITQDNNEITGTSIDTGGQGVSPDPAKIKGTIHNYFISFIKQYSSYHYSDLNGDVIIDRTRLGSEIFYTGLYNETEKEFSGDWKLIHKAKLFGIIPIKLSATGTWTMKRK
jgi:hypothetical protein